MSLRANTHMLKKLLVVAAAMFAFGYALVPMYRTICEITGINILALGEREMPGTGSAKAKLPVLSKGMTLPRMLLPRCG